MTNTMKKVAIALFMACLILPPVLWFGVMDESQETNLEKREHLAFPNLREVGWGSMFGSIEDWYVDNAPFKTLAVKVKNTLSTTLFGEVESNNVIYGEDGWLFYKGTGDGDSLLEYKGLLSLTDEEIAEYVRLFQSAQNNLKTQGIELYQIVVPNKETALADYMPSDIKRVKTMTRAEQLEEALQKADIESFDYISDEMEGGDSPLYLKLDTHWNYLGAYRGYQRLLEMMGSESISEVEFENAYRSTGDLADMISMDLYEPYADEVAGSLTYDLDSIVGGHAFLNYYKSTAESPNEQNVLIIGDSFRERFEEFVAQRFSTTVSVHRDAVGSEEFIALDYKPNAVVLISPERYVMNNLATLEWLSQARF